MNIPELLKEAESIFKIKLELYFSLIFRDITLPSHDLNHHRRVWNNAKELVQSLNNHGIEIGNEIPVKLIIGCYLHDSGMAVDRGIRHGYHGMLFCRKFLEDNHLNISNYNDLLTAVENHDGKEYNGNNKPDDLFTVLSVSDDLDAFGITGIYR
jgi:HD superfamily phosphodiesterase